MGANRDLEVLSKPFKGFVEGWLEECREEGYDIFVTEGLRSGERQAELYAQGRTKSGRVVTWTLNSVHMTGNAVDIAFRGSELYPGDFGKWREVADIGKKYHIKWGFDMWGCDKPHFEYGGTYQELDKDLLHNYVIMSEEQKQLVEAAIYALKNMHNFGSVKMKELAAEQAAELRGLLDE